MHTSLSAFSNLIAQQHLKQSQLEALIELLIWTMYVDNSIKLEENDALDEFLGRVEWHSPMQVDYFMSTAIAKVRNSIDDPTKAEKLIGDINTRLADPMTRREAADAVQALAEADGELTDSEKSFIGKIKLLFGT